MELKEIAYGSTAYALSKKLREEVLRLPIGLVLTDKDVEGEETHIHVAATENGEVLATVQLKPLSADTVKLRQMAVSPRLQGQGWGKSLVLFAETIARSKQFKLIECHARISAQVFYEKLGYSTTGEPFTEVGLPTIKMIKKL